MSLPEFNFADGSPIFTPMTFLIRSPVEAETLVTSMDHARELGLPQRHLDILNQLFRDNPGMRIALSPESEFDDTFAGPRAGFCMFDPGVLA